MGSLAQGTLTLFGAGLINRILGFFYRILLAQRLGSQGLGLIGFAFPVLHIAITAATAGLPVAVSKLVAERAAVAPQRVRAVLRSAMLFVLVSAGLITILLIVLVRPIADHVLTDRRALYPLVVLIPLLLIVGVSSVMRGYFQGLQRMTPSAVGSVVEQIIRIAAALWLIGRFLPMGITWATAAAAAGMVLGELAGLAVLGISFWLRPGPPPPPPFASPGLAQGTLRELLGISLPVSFTRIIGSITEFLDATLIPRRLEVAGLTRDASTAFFGTLTGMVFPLLFFPTVITFALSQALVPAVSDAYARGNLQLVRRRTNQSLYVALVVSLYSSAVFAVLGHTLGILFFGQRSVGDLLQPLAIAAPFLYLEVTVSSVLRGIGKAALSMYNGLAGSAVRLVVVYFLSGLPSVGERGVVLGIALDLIISFLLNFAALSRVIGYSADLRRLLLPPAAATVVALVLLGPVKSLMISAGTSLWPATIGSIVVGTAGYLLALLTVGGRRQFRLP